MDQRIAVILNAHAGTRNDESIRQKIAALFRTHAREAEVSIAPAQGLQQLAEQTARGAADVVVAAGGDGTVACVAAALAGTEKALGVLPLGTLNHFAKDLGIPQGLDEAANTIATGQSIRVDVGEVNGRVFVNNSSLGMYPLVVSHRDAQRRQFGRGKWLAFFWATLHVLRRYPLLEVRIAAEGQKLSRHTPSVFIGNNPYAISGLDLGSRPTLQAGTLGVYVTRDTGRLGLFGFLGRAMCGRLNQTADFTALRTTEAWIETRQRHLLVATDGEVTPMTSPLHYRTRPGALRVLVPRSLHPA